MFCPTNEKLQNFTEKTKLLAQKCSQQIRVAAQQHLQQQQQHQQQQQQQLSLEHKESIKNVENGDQNTENNKIKSLNNSNNSTIISGKNRSNISNSSSSSSNSGNSSSGVKYLCSCTGGTLKGLTGNKKHKDGQATVKWYVKQPTWRLWGEEREKDAIFTVYLKKVRYHRPTPSANNDSDDEISHLEWETVRVRFVKAATLQRLVEALATDDGELESTFINVFLSTYRTFSNLKEVLDLLIKRYDKLNEMILNDEQNKYHNQQQQYPQYNDHYQNEFDTTNSSSYRLLTSSSSSSSSGSIYEQHRKTLVSALHVWLDGFPEDWNEDNLRHILNFTSKRLSHTELHIKILQRLERYLRIPPSRLINDQNYMNYDHHNHHHQQQSYWTNSTSLLSSYPPMSILSSIITSGSSSSSTASTADISDLFGGMCLTPAFRGPPSHLLQAYRFPHVPVKHFAEQLTRMDMELFKRLIPHQCLGATWSRRDKNEAETVVATVNQFNAVSFRVISSILVEPRLKPQERALHIATWIDIGQELRLLKNFSSLKAIISGLQSNAVYRLSKTWAALSKEKLEIFNELARIFSEDNNAWTQREVLMREGTAKFADTVGENDRHLQKVFQKQDTHTSHGTIPYLGTFLTDLTMIHAAIPDTVSDSLINFDKKRKEFEILAQIKLLQGAANAYNLKPDHHFDRWFSSMLVLDEREAHAISCQIEPPPESKKSNNSSVASGLGLNTVGNNSGCGGSIGSSGTGGNCYGHKKSDSIASNSSSGAGSQFYCEINTLTAGNSCNTSKNNSRNNSLDRDTIPPNSSLQSASSSISNLSIDSSNSGGYSCIIGGGSGGNGAGHKSHSTISTTTATSNSHKCNGKHLTSTPSSSSSMSSAAVAAINDGIPIINAQLIQTPQMKNSSPDFYIIRVTYETNDVETNGIVLYKSIMLGNNERTPQVIRNAMMKLGLEDDPDKWTLSQVLPDKELLMPPNANVYYAVNTAYNLNFILRRKKDDSVRGQ